MSPSLFFFFFIFFTSFCHIIVTQSQKRRLFKEQEARLLTLGLLSSSPQSPGAKDAKDLQRAIRMSKRDTNTRKQREEKELMKAVTASKLKGGAPVIFFAFCVGAFHFVLSRFGAPKLIFGCVVRRDMLCVLLFTTRARWLKLATTSLMFSIQRVARGNAMTISLSTRFELIPSPSHLSRFIL